MGFFFVFRRYDATIEHELTRLWPQMAFNVQDVLDTSFQWLDVDRTLNFDRDSITTLFNHYCPNKSDMLHIQFQIFALNMCHQSSDKCPNLLEWRLFYNCLSMNMLFLPKPVTALVTLIPMHDDRILTLQSYSKVCILMNPVILQRSTGEFWHLFPANTMDTHARKLDNMLAFPAIYEECLDICIRKAWYTSRMTIDSFFKLLTDAIDQNENISVVWCDIALKYNSISANCMPLAVLEKMSVDTRCYDRDTPSIICNMASCLKYNEYYLKTHIYDIVNELWPTCSDTRDLQPVECHAFYLGVIVCIALNNCIQSQTTRAISISGCGFFDAVCINASATDINDETYIVRTMGVLSECFYKGAVTASLAYSKRNNVVCSEYYNSHFSRGLFQFDLRQVRPTTDWALLSLDAVMTRMANTMLTTLTSNRTACKAFNVLDAATIPTHYNRKNHQRSCGLDLLKRLDIDYTVPYSIALQLRVIQSIAPFIDQSHANTLACSDTNLQNLPTLLHLSRAEPGYELKTVCSRFTRRRIVVPCKNKK